MELTPSIGIVHEERYFWHRSAVEYGPEVQEPAFFQIETPEPRRRLLNLLDTSGLLDQMQRFRAPILERADLLRVHTAEYVDRIAAANETGGEAGDYCPFGPGSYDIARLSCGGAYAASEAVVTGQVQRAYALVRPPGHHAERDRGRGYCLFANIPVAIEKLRAEHGPLRVAVLDWDVHHGNGTQWIFWDDPDTLTISLHQDGLYPHDSGNVTELGGPGAVGKNVNIPLPPGSGHGAYLEALKRIAEPAVRNFAPDLIIVACGFDASGYDPNARMMLTADAFGEFTGRIVTLASEITDGRLVFVQEGGYSPLYVPFCGQAVIGTLLGKSVPTSPVGKSKNVDPWQELQPHQHNAIEVARAAAVASGAVPA